MKFLAAYLLAQLNGEPTADRITNILSSVGIDADESKINKIIEELSGKDLNQVIAEGNAKLASVPSGGAAPVAGSASAPSGGAAPAAAEEKVEEKEESDEDMGFGLFD